MKLIQLKPFNKATVTPKIAAKIQAVVGINSLFEQEKYTKDGFTIIDEVNYKRYNPEGKLNGSQNFPELNPILAGLGYTVREVAHGITIKNNYEGLTHYSLRIWEDGRAIQYWLHRKGDWKSSSTGDKSKGIPASIEYYEKTTTGYEYPCNQVELVQLYIDLGFYTIEIK